MPTRTPITTHHDHCDAKCHTQRESRVIKPARDAKLEMIKVADRVRLAWRIHDLTIPTGIVTNIYSKGDVDVDWCAGHIINRESPGDLRMLESPARLPQ